MGSMRTQSLSTHRVVFVPTCLAKPGVGRGARVGVAVLYETRRDGKTPPTQCVWGGGAGGGRGGGSDDHAVAEEWEAGGETAR